MSDDYSVLLTEGMAFAMAIVCIIVGSIYDIGILVTIGLIMIAIPIILIIVLVIVIILVVVFA